ncbi:zinc-binding dehydrogenase [Saccharopolyspora rosea]|uniref:Zinc-binding dehydrogenase n=1 Tax=Saccharopolyspora rosea TaxID=524884 RepID=A0ABW3FWK2_9PSEU|nr:zinc-binding dehydrogenase [Saccharopolyspora rosea]
MLAVRVNRFGGPEVLVAEQLPEPVAGPGQVVVGVAVAATDFVQTQLRRGFTPGPPLPEPPYVPGGTVAGEVVSVGEGVDPGWLGRHVVTRTSDGYGGHAERAVADEAALVPVPAGVGLREAAALLDDGSTALGLVDNAPVAPGEWVLVEAAGGGVGSVLVQLASSAGARVIGAARGERKLAQVAELGAEQVVDYTEPDWAEKVRAIIGGGPDLVFDGVGGEIGRAAFEVTARGGRFSVHGASSGTATEVDPAEARRRGVEVLPLSQLYGLQHGVEKRAERVLAAVAAGALRPLIGQTFPLDRAAQAHAAMESRSVVGKTLLTT